MKSLFVTTLILGALLCVACISWKSPTLDVGRGHSFYLRSIETGRLYGPYSRGTVWTHYLRKFFMEIGCARFFRYM